MQRRSFHRLLGAGIAGAAFLPAFCASNHELPPVPVHSKPQRLRRGDTIGFITPGSFAPDDAVQKAYLNMEGLGLKVKAGKNLRALRGFNAGTDAERLEDLHAMFADPDVKAVWCVRGGYGCTRLLPDIDFELIRNNPKILIGYSDVTALLQAVYLETGLICFHGPVASATFTNYAKAQLAALLFDGVDNHPIKIADAQSLRKEPEYQPVVIRAGKATGLLAGGNLSLMAAMAGTPHAFDLKDKLVFIEETGERPYRLDRMLTTLLQASNLQEAAGIAIGVFTDCNPKKDELSLSMMETLRDRLRHLKIPVVYGLSFGHISDNCTLPVGIPAALDTHSLTITLAERAVM
ncbi:MAG: LD-carboxypeptidase [Saprospiraceae bacterium]|nr:LD-carboxypeptidase [Saprospiraceae bacterium]